VLKKPSHLFHSLYLNILNEFCDISRDREQQNHDGQSDKRTGCASQWAEHETRTLVGVPPTEDGVEKPYAQGYLQRDINNLCSDISQAGGTREK